MIAYDDVSGSDHSKSRDEVEHRIVVQSFDTFRQGYASAFFLKK
jgi:hypothetical protein